MVSGALPLPSLTTTKVGPGDKERAYVVRQNVFLKALLVSTSPCALAPCHSRTAQQRRRRCSTADRARCLAQAIAVVMCSLGILLCCTYLEVRVVKRGALEAATEHREEEHTSHMRIMRLSTLLQQRLEDEVHDMSALTTYRAWLLRSVGEFQSQVTDICTGTTQGAGDAPEDHGAADTPGPPVKQTRRQLRQAPPPLPPPLPPPHRPHHPPTASVLAATVAQRLFPRRSLPRPLLPTRRGWISTRSSTRSSSSSGTTSCALATTPHPLAAPRASPHFPRPGKLRAAR